VKKINKLRHPTQARENRPTAQGWAGAGETSRLRPIDKPEAIRIVRAILGKSQNIKEISEELDTKGVAVRKKTEKITKLNKKNVYGAGKYYIVFRG